jgi:hypothetical protein
MRSSATSGEPLSPRQAGRPGRRSRSGRARIGTGTAAAVLLGLLALAPSALASGSPQGPPAGPTTPPFTQCPAIGEDTTCQYLIDVKSTTEPPVIIEDPSQIYYDGTDDVTVAVQNETGLPLSKIHVGVLASGDGIFGFDGDGLCSSEITPKPSECPFAPEPNEEGSFSGTGNGYTGPDTEFIKAEGEPTEAGMVNFPTPLANDQYTYFTLEAPPYGTTIVAGEVNDTIATKLTAQTEPPTEEARLTLLTPVNVTDKATIAGPNAKFAEGAVEYKVYSDPGCTKEVANAGTAKVLEGVAEASKPVGASLPTNATYYWQVEYTGSKKGVPTEENSPARSVCGEESMSFGVVPVVTTLSGGGQIGTTLTVAPNTPVTDTATVSAGGQSVYGQIEYKVYSNASCTTEVANGGTVTTLTGIGPSSQPVALPTPGTYYFQASFTGTKVALTGKSPCGSEVVNVVPPPPVPNSGFGIKSIVGSPNGTVSITFIPTQSGTGTLVVTVPTASIASVSATAAKAKRCKPGQVKIKHRCLPSTTVTGKASASGTAGVPLTLTVFLSSKVKAQLKKGKTIHLTASLTYQSSLGGPPEVASLQVTVKGKRPHHHRRP